MGDKWRQVRSCLPLCEGFLFQASLVDAEGTFLVWEAVKWVGSFFCSEEAARRIHEISDKKTLVDSNFNIHILLVLLYSLHFQEDRVGLGQ